jgi:cytochrome c biogenesis protein CcmG, thiol:disulfide interchange protein DsbE
MNVTDQPPPPARAGRWLVALPLAFFAVLAIGFYAALQSGGPTALRSTLIGRAAPITPLPPIEGLSTPGIGAADFATGQPIVVNVWASWCGPCREEQPLLVALAERSKVPLYGINHKDRPGDAIAFLKRFGNPFARIGADRTGRASIEWGVYGVPETYVLDGRGTIIFKHIGPLSPASIDKDLLPAIARANAPLP